MRVRRLLVGVLTMTALAAAFSARADWQDDYRDGVTAADAGRWQDVAAAMRRAIAANPRASDERMRIYGMRFEPYTPHFYLGSALAQLGDCAGALEALQASLDSGVVQQTTRLAELRRIQEGCRAAMPTPTPTSPPLPTETPVPTGPDPDEVAEARRDLEAALLDAGAARERYQELVASREAATVLRRNPNLGPAVGDADTALARARGASDSDDPDVLRDAAAAARGAGEAYRVATGRVEAALASATPPRVQPTRTATPTPRPPATPRPTLAPLRAVAGPRRTPELEAATVAWLDGRTEDVVAALEQVPSSSDRVTAVALLLRSAARWSLWREGGSRDAELRAAALEDARRCHGTDSDVEPFADAFPPAFVVFFDSASR